MGCCRRRRRNTPTPPAQTVFRYPLTVGSVNGDDTGFVGDFRVPWSYADAAVAEGDVANLFGSGWSENTAYDHPIIAEGEAAGGALMWTNAWGTVTGLPATLPVGTTSVELRMAGTVDWTVSGSIGSGDYSAFQFAVFPPGGPASVLATRSPTSFGGNPGLFVTGAAVVASPDDGTEAFDVTLTLDYGGDWSTFDLNYGAEVAIGFAASPGNVRVYAYESVLELELIVTTA